MNIVFFGTSGFAVPSLEKLWKHHDVVAVVTKPDKPRGRRLISVPSPVKEAAGRLKLPVVSIEGSSAAQAESLLKAHDADLFIVIAYGRILPLKVLSLPRLYPIGLHASLLPKYRGPSPINWAILKGERETGVTVFRLNEEMDAGDIIMQKPIDILYSDNAETLSIKLANLGANLLVKAVDAIGERMPQLIKQDSREATFTRKLRKEDGILNWEEPAVDIHNKVRGLYGWPGAFSRFGTTTIKIWKTSLVPAPGTAGESAKPGEIVKIERAGISVACGKDALLIIELQAEGGKRMKAADYALGHRVSAGDRFLK